MRTGEIITIEGEVRDDHIDMKRQDVVKSLCDDYRSDPTRSVQGQRQGRELRRRTVLDYRKLLEEDEGTKRSLKDMHFEMAVDMQDVKTKKMLE